MVNSGFDKLSQQCIRKVFNLNWEVIMKKGILIGLVVSWVFGVICGYFLFFIFAGALWHGERNTPQVEKHIQDKVDPAVFYANDSVLIYEVSAEMTKTTFGKKTHIKYKIRNIGNRTLTLVKIKIYLLDNQDKAIYEMEHSAIWTSDLFSDAPGPLKPNYIRSISTFVPNALEVEDCPTEWTGGKVKLQITEIKFDK